MVFWIPVAGLAFFLRNRLDAPTKKAAWITMALMAPASAAMEYIYLWADIWTFSEKLDPLLGIWIGPAPIEEFSFWFGSIPFMLFTYLSFSALFPKKR